MKNLLGKAILFLLAFVAATNARAAEEPKQTAKVHLLVPAYFYPAEQGLKHWDKLLESPALAFTIAIVNPASGPGDKVDPNYVAVFERAKKTKMTLLGYVTTSYSKRTLADVKKDVDQWLRLYPGIVGIFFDEQASGADKVEYQAELYNYVRKKKGLKLVVTNPGTVCAEGYLSRPAADVVCLFEHHTGWEKYRPPEWLDRYGSNRAAALLYKIGSAEQMRARLKEAAARKAGYVYVTDAEGDNPWDRLPRYWDDEVAAVLQLNEVKK